MHTASTWSSGAHGGMQPFRSCGPGPQYLPGSAGVRVRVRVHVRVRLRVHTRERVRLRLRLRLLAVGRLSASYRNAAYRCGSPCSVSLEVSAEMGPMEQPPSSR